MPRINSADLQSRLHSGLRRIEGASVRLAELAWSIPMFLTPADVSDLLQEASREEIGRRFVDLYEANAREHLNEMAKRLTSRENLRPWCKLLQQSVSAYRRRQFAITIPALLVVCEGVLMAGKGKRTDLRNVVAESVRRVERDIPNSFTLVLWRSVKYFVDQLYLTSNFSGPPPDLLNRHWILHGRDAANWTHADSLRMFQAADTLSKVAELQGSSKRIQRTL